MTIRLRSLLAPFAVLILLAGCQEEAAAPPPEKLTRAAIGHYCNMIVADHPGPKAQIHEHAMSTPLWFSSVRDGLAYVMLPGEAQKVTAFYVHDMGRAKSWDAPPDDGVWIKAEDAHYVLDSSLRGGMGAQEAAPFADRVAAEAFAAKHGGRVVAYADIPKDYVIGDDNDHGGGTAHSGHRAPGTPAAANHPAAHDKASIDHSAHKKRPAADHPGHTGHGGGDG